MINTQLQCIIPDCYIGPWFINHPMRLLTVLAPTSCATRRGRAAPAPARRGEPRGFEMQWRNGAEKW